jgi:hypothetical protein
MYICPKACCSTLLTKEMQIKVIKRHEAVTIMVAVIKINKYNITTVDNYTEKI